MTSPGGLDATATGVLRFDASAVRPGVLEANSALQQLYGTVKDNWWGVRNLGEVFTALGGAMSGGLAAAGSAAVGFEAATAVVFKNVADSATLVPEQMEKIRQGLLNMSTQSAVSLDNLVKIAQQGALFGIASDQILEFTKKVADLTVGTNLTVQDIGALKQVMNQFNLPVDQIDRLGSALFVAEKNSSSNASSILTLTKQYGSLFHEIGITADQAIGLAAALKSQGGAAQSSATAVINTILKIGQAATNNTTLFDNYAKVAGVTSAQFRDMVRDNPVQAFISLSEGLSKVNHNAVDVAAVFDDLGIKNKRQVVALEDLAAAATKTVGGQASLAEQLRATAAAYQDTSDYQKEVERQSHTTAAEIQTLKNDMHVLAIGIGSDLLPPIRFLVEALQNVVLGFNSMPGPLKAVLEIVGALGGGTFLLAGAFLLLVPRLAQAAAAVGQLKGVLVEYNIVRAEAHAITLANEGEEAAAALVSTSLMGNKLKQYKEIVATEREFQAAQKAGLGLEVARLGAIETENAARLATVAAEEAFEEKLVLEAAAAEAAAAGHAELTTVLTAQAEAASLASEAQAAEALALQADAVAAAEAVAALEAEAVANAAAAAAAEGSIPAVTAFGAALDVALGPVGWIVLGLTALVAAVVAISYFVGRAKKDTDAYKDSNDQLVQSLRSGQASFQKTANDFILQDKNMANLIDTSDRLKISLAEMFAVMRGDATKAQEADFYNKTQAGLKNNVEGTQAYIDAAVKMNRTIVASAREADTLSQANQKVDGTNKDTTASTLGLADANQKATSSADTRAQAELSLVDDMMALDDAQERVKEATKKLSDARKALADNSVALQQAEDNLASAQIAQRAAVEHLHQAQEDLSVARKKAHDQLVNDTNDLASAQEKIIVDTYKQADAQAAYDKVMSGPTLEEVTKLTNALADARSSLWHATETVADAEFNLQYLIGQGASERDIADATQAIVDAKNAQADATQKVGDAQTALNTATAGPTPEQQAQAALALAEANATLAQDLQHVSDLTRKVHDDQVAIAHDQAYHDAQDAVLSAQIALNTANQNVISSTHKLHEEQNKTQETLDYAAAQNDLRDAIVNEAKAEVAVTKDKYEILTGQAFTAQQQVDALNGALNHQADLIGGPIAQQIRNYAAELRHVPTHVNTTVDANTTPATQKIHTLDTNITNTATKHRGTMDKIFQFLDPLGIDHAIFNYVVVPLGTRAVQMGVTIKDKFEEAWHWVTTRGGQYFVSFFTNLPSTIASLIVRLGEYIANALSSTIGHGIMSGLGTFLNGASGGLLNLGVSVVGHLLPGHAEGGVTTAPHVAMVGEAGPEVIAPLAQFAAMFAPISALTAQLAVANNRSNESRSAAGGTAVPRGGDNINIYAPTGDGRDIAAELEFFSFTRK